MVDEENGADGVGEDAVEDDVEDKKPATLEEKVEDLERDVVELMEEMEDVIGEMGRLKSEMLRMSKLMGSASNAVSTKDDKALKDVASRFKR